MSLPFEVFYAELNPRLTSLARASVPDCDHEDVVQQTWMVFSADTQRVANPQPHVGLLYLILSQRVIDYWRGVNKRREMPLEPPASNDGYGIDPPAVVPSPLDEALEAERQKQIPEFLSQLSRGVSGRIVKAMASLGYADEVNHYQILLCFLRRELKGEVMKRWDFAKQLRTALQLSEPAFNTAVFRLRALARAGGHVQAGYPPSPKK